jgi:predicted NBD/HSP70 family sugar kinase
MGPAWGIDLGGTKIEGVILEDRESANVLKRLRIPTEAKNGYEHIIGQIGRLVEVLIAETGIKPDRIGIGTPGTIEPSTGLMKNSNTTCLNGMPLHRDIERTLGIKVEMANDANCFAIAETKLGAVKAKVPDAKVVFGIIMGTGVGGGLIVDGKIISGRHGIGGEWGHNFLDESGGDCYCGKVGCVERILSGPNLEKYYEDIVGVHKKLKDIVSAHKAGDDEVATKTVHRLLHFFGKGFANIINTIDPDAVVIGGGLGNIDLLYTDGVWEVEKHIFNYTLETPFLRPMLGDSAGVFGAALL